MNALFAKANTKNLFPQIYTEYYIYAQNCAWGLEQVNRHIPKSAFRPAALIGVQFGFNAFIEELEMAARHWENYRDALNVFWEDRAA